MDNRDSSSSFQLIEPLTPREAGILAHLAEHRSNREIAELETLALNSVKWYVQQIYTKLGVNSRGEAIERAKELGLLKTEPVTPVVPRNNLPRQLNRFIGREVEIARVTELMGNSALVTLTGSGGVGKTRLSLAAAEKLLSDFQDGVWLVELAALSDPANVPQAVATVLDVREVPGKTITASLVDFLRGRRLLLILDNCEHLVAACAQLVETLLRACPGLHILATSREVLGIEGEVAYSVPSLSTPDSRELPSLEALPRYDAVRLFIERARIVSTGFSLTGDNAPYVVQICQRLDGIPLAIELAAARLRLLSAEQIAQRLNDVFRLLTGGSRTALPRQQTLRALIDWSYNLLSQTEQVLLSQLSVFHGGWTLEAAETICMNGSTLDLLSGLVDKSLVLVSQGEAEQPRYRMLETVRQYAQEKLWESGKTEAVRRRHLDYYLGWAEVIEPNLRGRQQKVTLDRLEADRDNLRAALEWSFEVDNQAELRLAGALMWFWHIRDLHSEGIHWLEGGISVEPQARGSRPLSPTQIRVRAKALGATGLLRTMRREMDKAAVWLDESLELYRQLGMDGKSGAGFVLHWQGLGAYFQHDYTRAIALGREGLALYRETGEEFGTGECLKLIGQSIMESTTAFDQARALLEENLSLQEKIGDLDGIATALYMLAGLAQQEKAPDRAAALYEKSLEYYRQVGNNQLVVEIYSKLGQTAWSRGDFQQADRWLTEALPIMRDVRDKGSFVIGVVLINLGYLSLVRGDYGRATSLFEEVHSIYRDMDEDDARSVITAVLVGMARVAWAQGDSPKALRLCEEADHLSRRVKYDHTYQDALAFLAWVYLLQGDLAQALSLFNEAYQSWSSPGVNRDDLTCFMLASLAVMAVAQQKAGTAARLFGVIEEMHTIMMKFLSPAELAVIDDSRAAARRALGEEPFEAAFAEGRRLKMEQILALAQGLGQTG